MTKSLGVSWFLVAVALLGGCDGVPVPLEVERPDSPGFIGSSPEFASGASSTWSAIRSHDAGTFAVPLGHLGRGGTQAVAINARGHVTGTTRDEFGRRTAFFWSATNGMRDLRLDLPFAVGGSLEAVDINNRSMVIGWGEELMPWMFRWSATGDVQLFTCGLDFPVPLGINNQGRIVGVGESQLMIVLPSGFHTAFSAFGYKNGNCELLMDEGFIALTASVINDRGEFSGVGGHYEELDIPDAAVWLRIVDDDLQPYVWSPGGGFRVGEALYDDRYRSASGDYVEGSNLFTTSPARYGLRPGGTEPRPSVRGEIDSLEGGEKFGRGCSSVVALARAGDVEFFTACMEYLRPAEPSG